MSLWPVACQAPLSMGFSRQQYWNGLPFSSPGDLPDPGIKPESPVSPVDSLPLSHQGSLCMVHTHTHICTYINLQDEESRVTRKIQEGQLNLNFR